MIDHWWQTETGWCIAGNPFGLGLLPVKPGSATVPMPGYVLEVVDEAGKPVPTGTMGSFIIKLPLRLVASRRSGRKTARWHESYLADYPGFYKTSDAGLMDEDGHVFLLGRTDDIINCAGHRLSTGGMERCWPRCPDVAECAVIGVADNDQGRGALRIFGLKSGVTKTGPAIECEAVAIIRDKIGPVADSRRRSSSTACRRPGPARSYAAR